LASLGRLAPLVVWIDMLEEDSEQAAALAADRLDGKRLAVHFHDPARAVGAAVAEALGGRGKVAWDFYLFYPPGLRWDGRAPVPEVAYHQLVGAAWAGLTRYRTGRRLVKSLRSAVARFGRPGSP
jgi:hypothetical protein